MPLTRPLSDSVVVVTGASSGIGAGVALMLARRGTRVVLAARGEPALSELAERCQRWGTAALVVPTDVSDSVAVQRLADTARDRFGRIDAWINNAAVGVYGRLLDLPMQDLRRVVDVNLMGYLHGARAAVPALRAAGGGVLVMVASLLGEVSVPYMGAYTIAKHGVLGLCNTLRQELRGEGTTEVSVCAVLPASIDTPFFSHAANHTGRAIRPVPPVNPPWRIAGRIIRLLESPRRQAYAGLGGTALGLTWRFAPGITERLLAAYAKRVTFISDRAAPVTLGTLYEPPSQPLEVEGGWRRHDLTGLAEVPSVVGR